MRNLWMTLAYDGAAFKGWQRQSGQPTVQETLEESLYRITGHRPRITGSGRTDAGVHALGQVAGFSSPATMPLEEMRRALNATVPRSIRVWNIDPAPASFHAQKSALGKRYAYLVQLGRESLPFGREYSARVSYPLSLGAMREGAERIRGRRDFAALATNPGYERGSTVRTVEHLHLHRRRSRLWIVVQGNGFLYNMVRTIAGTLVDVGRGRFSPNDVEEILASKDRRQAGPVMPAAGLYLLRVLYGTTDLDSPGRPGVGGATSYLPGRRRGLDQRRLDESRSYGAGKRAHREGAELRGAEDR